MDVDVEEDQDVDPNDYRLVEDHHHQIFVTWPYISVQSKKTGNIHEIPFEKVAQHFNLTRVNNPDGTFYIQRVIPGPSRNAGLLPPLGIGSQPSPDVRSQPSSGVSSPGAKEDKKWGIEETKRLIDLKAEFVDQIGPMKTFANKKCMWRQIAIKLNEEFESNVTETQVENRYKTVSRHNKKRIAHNRQSGNDKMYTPYDQEFDGLAKKDESVDPYLLTQDVEIAGNSVNIAENSTDQVRSDDQHCESLENVEKKKRTKLDILTEVYQTQCELRAQERQDLKIEKELEKVKASKEKQERFMYAEERKDKRHLEKMALLNNLISAMKSQDKGNND